MLSACEMVVNKGRCREAEDCKDSEVFLVVETQRRLVGGDSAEQLQIGLDIGRLSPPVVSTSLSYISDLIGACIGVVGT